MWECILGICFGIIYLVIWIISAKKHIVGPEETWEFILGVFP